MESSSPSDPKQSSDFQTPPPKPSGSGWVIALVLVGVIGLMSCVCITGGAFFVIGARQEAQRMQSSNNLKQIGLALHNYHTAHGVFPPAFTADENGRPHSSWRTLLMPFFYYDRPDIVNFDKPWDDTANAHLREMEIPIFHSPRDSNSDARFTNYLAVTGEGTILSGDRATSIDAVRDGTSMTMMIVEVLNSDVEWSEPRDLDVNNIQRVDEGADPLATNVIASGGVVLFADGSVRTLSAEVTREMLDIYITRAGGEAAPDWPYEK